VTRPLALAFALAVPLALAQAPGAEEHKPATKQPARPAAAPQKAQKPRGARGTPKAHAKPTPDQIRRFNELQKQQGGKS
jgi:hypothetical protein